MQITLPDDPQFQETAAAAGFANVEEYVKAMFRKQNEQSEKGETTARSPLSHDEWKREFRDYLNSLKPRNPNVDDSRESIYPVRG